MPDARPNLCLFILAGGFTLAHTAHFGWHVYPQSIAELICDGASILLLWLSIRRRQPAGKRSGASN